MSCDRPHALLLERDDWVNKHLAQEWRVPPESKARCATALNYFERRNPDPEPGV